MNRAAPRVYHLALFFSRNIVSCSAMGYQFRGMDVENIGTALSLARVLRANLSLRAFAAQRVCSIIRKSTYVANRKKKKKNEGRYKGNNKIEKEGESMPGDQLYQ